MRIEHEITIASSPETVFGLTVDVERWPSLMPTVTSATLLGDGAFDVGSQARLVQPGQRPTVWTVAELDAPTRFVWSARQPGLRLTAHHTVTPTGEGCRNRLVIDLDGPGAVLLGRLLRRRIARTLATENECFRRAAESAAS